MASRATPRSVHRGRDAEPDRVRGTYPLPEAQLDPVPPRRSTSDIPAGRWGGRAPGSCTRRCRTRHAHRCAGGQRRLLRSRRRATVDRRPWSPKGHRVCHRAGAPDASWPSVALGASRECSAPARGGEGVGAPRRSRLRDARRRRRGRTGRAAPPAATAARGGAGRYTPDDAVATAISSVPVRDEPVGPSPRAALALLIVGLGALRRTRTGCARGRSRGRGRDRGRHAARATPARVRRASPAR